MIPGAGFSGDVIESFAQFVAPRFGVRVQHVLTDQTNRVRFLKVNRSFRPDLVVFNNRHWRPGDFTDFSAHQFHFLEGAVDTTRFRPAPVATTEKRQFIIGGLANKNPAPLIEAVRSHAGSLELRLFGRSGNLSETSSDLIEAGKLKLIGMLNEDALAEFYRGVDCVVHTELSAGWANLAAEALASGVPLICTPHGTLAFARHEDTALVIEQPVASAINAAIDRLRADPDLRRELCTNGRKAIAQYDWEAYTAELLRLISGDINPHYAFAPELGLHGKWPIELRLQGLERLFRDCAGKTILDLGAAEGTIASLLLEAGASTVHGIDVEPSRVARARVICRNFSHASFQVADLSNWDAFRVTLPPNARYDIVLSLGLHHHLPPLARRETLIGAAQLAREKLVIRVPPDVYAGDDIGGVMKGCGFVLVEEPEGSSEGANVGPVRMFKRIAQA